METGWIKIHRKLLKWEWIDAPNVVCLFIYCLLSANWESKKWHGNIIERGSFITSLSHLAINTGLTISQVRTALNKLKLTNELTIKATNKYRVISINNWGAYQLVDKQVDNQMTIKQQSNDNQMTTTKEYKEYKEYKKGDDAPKFNGELSLTSNQLEKLQRDFPKADVPRAYQRFKLWQRSEGKYLRKPIDRFRLWLMDDETKLTKEEVKFVKIR